MTLNIDDLKALIKRRLSHDSINKYAVTKNPFYIRRHIQTTSTWMVKNVPC